MNILELSGDTGSTKFIADHLSVFFKNKGHSVDIIAPVHGCLNPAVIFKIISKRPSYDVIHAHLGSASLLAGMVGRWLNIPVLTTLHGFQKAKHYKNVKHFTAVSQAVKTHFVNQGMNANGIKVIHNGYDPKILESQPLPIEVNQNKCFVVGTVGTLTPVKRHDLLLKSLKNLVQTYPNILLLIAGKGELEDVLRVQIAELGLQNNVSLVGFIEDTGAFYKSLDLYVQTSYHEGFCMPILEAMACGVPVLTTANRGSASYISNHKDAVIIDDDSVESITENMIALINNKDIQLLGRNAANKVIDMTWQSIADEYENQLLELTV